MTAVPLGLFNTGVRGSGGLLADGEMDPHYLLWESPDPSFPGPGTWVALSSDWPFGFWLPDGPDSKWISPRSDVSEGNNGGVYVYRTTFDLTGLDPATAAINGRWASDNEGLDLQLNGASTGISHFGTGTFAAFAAFSITNGFVPGTNTLDFVVHQDATGTATGLRVELSGTAEAPVIPGPVVAIASPADGVVFCPGTNVIVNVSARGRDAPLARVELYAGTALLAAQTNSPYAFELNGLAVGNYAFSAKAIDVQGQSATSAVVNASVSGSCARRVAIISGAADPDLEAVRTALFQMGLGITELDAADLRTNSMQGLEAILWLDSAGMPGAFTETTLGALQQAQGQGVSVYFLGDSLASDVEALEEPARSAWTVLLHWQPVTAQATDGVVHVNRDVPIHPVVQGVFGARAVADFTYAVAGVASPTADAGSLAIWGNGVVIVVFPGGLNSDTNHTRVVTQLFSVAAGGDDSSKAQRLVLFENAVYWLLGWVPCSTYALNLDMEATNTVALGQEIVYSLSVQHQGECEGTGVVLTDQLPDQLQFMGAEAEVGSVGSTNGLLTFRIGHMSSASAARLTIRALAVQAGAATNCAAVSGDGHPAGAAGQIACAVVNIRSSQSIPPTLSILGATSAGVELEISAPGGPSCAMEASTDLKQWVHLTNVALRAPAVRWTDSTGTNLTRRFYRARQFPSP
jgi:uncharacterized repeat protein (TIGR01451 family)